MHSRKRRTRLPPLDISGVPVVQSSPNACDASAHSHRPGDTDEHIPALPPGRGPPDKLHDVRAGLRRIISAAGSSGGDFADAAHGSCGKAKDGRGNRRQTVRDACPLTCVRVPACSELSCVANGAHVHRWCARCPPPANAAATCACDVKRRQLCERGAAPTWAPRVYNCTGPQWRCSADVNTWWPFTSVCEGGYKRALAYTHLD